MKRAITQSAITIVCIAVIYALSFLGDQYRTEVAIVRFCIMVPLILINAILAFTLLLSLYRQNKKFSWKEVTLLMPPVLVGIALLIFALYLYIHFVIFR